MRIFFDKLAITYIVFISTFIICRLAMLSILICLLISILAQILAFCLLQLVIKSKQSVISYSEFVKLLITSNYNYVTQLYSEVYQTNMEIADRYLLINNKVHFLHLKFSNPSADGLVDIYKFCQANNITNAVIVCKEKDKKMYLLTHFFDKLTLQFDDYKTLYKKLNKSNLLPVHDKANKPSFVQSIKTILMTAFQRKNCKHFLFASFILCIFSFITPLSTYYLIMASLCVILAVICLFII